MKEILLPELGEGIKAATVACWHVKPGELVNVNQDIVEVVTDKAVFNIAAPASGSLIMIHVAEGKEAAVGQTLGLIRTG